MTDIKMIIGVKEANQICKDALLKHVAEQGLEDVVCERYFEVAIRNGKFLNCKRKGIIFKGQKHEDKQTEVSGRQRSGTGQYVSAGGQG